MWHINTVSKEKPDVRCFVNSLPILLPSITCGEKENTQNMNKRMVFPWNFAIVLVTLTVLHVRGPSS